MKKILFLFFCLLLTWPATAQSQRGKQRKFSHEEFRHKLELYIIQAAELSPDEAAKFFPIFHEMKEKQFKIGHKIMKLKRSQQNGKEIDGEDFDDDEDWSEAVIEIEELKVKQAQIGLNYTRRLCKTISGQKVFKAMKAEDAFHRQMLKNFRKGSR